MCVMMEQRDKDKAAEKKAKKEKAAEELKKEEEKKKKESPPKPTPPTQPPKPEEPKTTKGAYKDFFVKDPKTGKKTLKIQIYEEAPNAADDIYQGYEEPEFEADDDDQEYWLDFLHQYS